MSLLTTLALAGLLAGEAPHANPGCGTGDIPLGDLYLSSEPDLYRRYIGTGEPGDLEIEPFTPFTFYLVADIDYCECGDCGLNSTAGFIAWEAQLDLTEAASVTIISAALTWGPVCDFGCTASRHNFAVSTGSCISTDTGPLVLVTITGLINNPQGAMAQQIGLLAADPPGRFSPGWTQCSPPAGILYPFKSTEDIAGSGGFEENFIVINPGPIAVESTNFGKLKACYDR